MKIYIDWKAIKSEEAFYQKILPQLDAPDWHGHNLNALSDSIVTGDINGIEPPYCVINTNIGDTQPELQEFRKKVILILEEAKAAGRKVRMFNE